MSERGFDLFKGIRDLYGEGGEHEDARKREVKVLKEKEDLIEKQNKELEKQNKEILELREEVKELRKRLRDAGC